MEIEDISDAQFERAAEETLIGPSGIEKAFYTTVAGVSYRNADGSKRTDIIQQCDVGAVLELRPEPDNQFDPNAVAVVRLGLGEQLGYLDARLASEVVKDFREYGSCWLGLFRHADYHPETRAIVGAVIYLMRLPMEKLAATDESAS
jgi:hypothetical protein